MSRLIGALLIVVGLSEFGLAVWWLVSTI